MAERHTRQARSAGSGGPGHRPVPKGGVAHVSAEDQISAGGCWCGLPIWHTWPGKDKGASHPRDPEWFKEERMPATSTQIGKADIKGFDSKVAEAIVHIVNNLKVPYRVMDGTHVMLYPPDGTRPFKVAASRQVTTNLRILAGFIRDHCAVEVAAWEKAEAERRQAEPTTNRVVTFKGGGLSKEPLEVVADTAPPALVDKAGGEPISKPVAPEPTPEPEAPEAPVVAATEPVKRKQGNATGTWPCPECDFVAESTSQLGGHTKGHSAHRRRLREALDLIITETVGEYSTDDSKKVAALTTEVERLKAENAELTHKYGELEARFALAKEAFGV